MKIELFAAIGDGEKTLLDAFVIDNVAKQYEAEIEHLKRENKKEIDDRKKREDKDKKSKKKKDKKDKKDKKEEKEDKED